MSSGVSTLASQRFASSGSVLLRSAPARSAPGSISSGVTSSSFGISISRTDTHPINSIRLSPFGLGRDSFQSDSRGSAAGVLVAGPSGVGKTTLARHTLRRVSTERPAAVAHLRCLGLSPTEVLAAAVRKHPGGTVPSERDPDRTALRCALRAVIDESYIIILDALADIEGVSLVVCVHDADDWLARVDRAQQAAFREQIHLDTAWPNSQTFWSAGRARDFSGMRFDGPSWS
jgi:hypothetical protein